VSVHGIVVHHRHKHGKTLLLLEVQISLLDHVSVLTVHRTALSTYEVTLLVELAVVNRGDRVCP